MTQPKVVKSFQLDPADLQQRAVLRWLDQQSNQSDAIRAVLIAHAYGAAAATLPAILDEVRVCRRLLESGARASAQLAADLEPARVSEDQDLASALDSLGAL